VGEVKYISIQAFFTSSAFSLGLGAF